MARYETTIETAGLQVNRAFAHLSDFTSAQDWDPGVIRADRNDRGAIRVGSTFDLVASFLGREIPLTYEIVELSPNDHVVLRAENESVVSLDELRFTATDDGCAVTYRAQLDGKGWFRIMGPVLQQLFNRIGRTAEEGLAGYLERLADAGRAGTAPVEPVEGSSKR